MPEPTPPQTVGPFFSIGLGWADGPAVVPPGSEGAIAIRGTVLDGDGAPVPDALIETWQTDPAPPAASGLRVTIFQRPCSSVGQRPKPRQPSPGACHVSTSASGTGAPSPS